MVLRTVSFCICFCFYLLISGISFHNCNFILVLWLVWHLDGLIFQCVSVISIILAFYLMWNLCVSWLGLTEANYNVFSYFRETSLLCCDIKMFCVLRWSPGLLYPKQDRCLSPLFVFSSPAWRRITYKYNRVELIL